MGDGDGVPWHERGDDTSREDHGANAGRARSVREVDDHAVGISLRVGAGDGARDRIDREADEHGVAKGHASRRDGNGDRRPRGVVREEPDVLDECDRGERLRSVRKLKGAA